MSPDTCPRQAGSGELLPAVGKFPKRFSNFVTLPDSGVHGTPRGASAPPECGGTAFIGEGKERRERLGELTGAHRAGRPGGGAEQSGTALHYCLGRGPGRSGAGTRSALPSFPFPSLPLFSVPFLSLPSAPARPLPAPRWRRGRGRGGPPAPSALARPTKGPPEGGAARGGDQGEEKGEDGRTDRQTAAARTESCGSASAAPRESLPGPGSEEEPSRAGPCPR